VRNARNARDAYPMPVTRPASIAVALLLIASPCAAVSSAAFGVRQPIPTIEDRVGWQLSEGCRVYKFGILTEPDCDILTGEGVILQITRVRLLSLPPGQDDRPVIGIQVQPKHGDWAFSSPFAVLFIAGKSYSPAHIDNALVFDGSDRPVFTEKLQPSQPRYELPNGEKRFFRLRFSVSQTELRNGFTLQVTGLQMEGHAVRVPLLQFK
jgi:hypothetical protein